MAKRVWDGPAVRQVDGRAERFQMAQRYIADADRAWSEGEEELIVQWVHDGPTDSPPWAG